MAVTSSAALLALLLGLTLVAWRRYLWAEEQAQHDQADTSPDSLTDVFGDRHMVNVPHQKGVRWLSDVFSRTARRFPDHTALQVPHTGESLTYAELDAHAERVAAALSPVLTGPDQVVAVAMEQDSSHIVACHLGILRAGGTVMFLDTTLPETLIVHMLEDARPAVVLTRGENGFRDLPTLDVLELPEETAERTPPPWLDDPRQRLAALFYTSGTTGRPKGVECPHAGFVNLALSYSDYYDLVPGQDATSLMSSLGYDGSISEMYSAWVSGCAVVLLTKEEVRSGPELLPVLREAEVTVLFCPPVLLTTLTHHPEQDLPYPLCRYVVPAGEAFPPALVEPWTRGRRQVINTYGPTEASTDTSRQSLRPGEPVTIGTPFANVTYVILEPGGLDPLPHGEEGELCIGGVHLARGYRHQPELTARTFIAHPRFGRLYRTGDRCQIDPRNLQVHFLGRIDAQLKVRGHRVETQAVEDILQSQFVEIETAVLDYQNRELVAFVHAPAVAGEDHPTVTPAPAEWASRVTASLAKRLPPPSVPTRFFLVEEFALKPVSGKIDRESLPRLSLRNHAAANGMSAGSGSPTGSPETGPSRPPGPGSEEDPEPGSEEVLGICRDVFETPLGWDDVFVDHGGHSLAIARLAARLRAAGWAVPVRALLSDRNTARKVAQHPRELEEAAAFPPEAARTRRASTGRDETAARVLSVGLFTSLQALFLLLLYAPALISFLALVSFGNVGEFFITAPLWQFVGAGLSLYLLSHVLPFASLCWVMVIKVLIGGHPRKSRVAPGVYPRWSRMHLRTWCIQRLEQSVLRPLALGSLFRSPPLLAFLLRRLGATVGHNLQCAQDADLQGPLDLLSVEDDVAIQTGAYVHTSRWVGQDLHIGPVRLESGCKIGMRAAVADHVTVGRGAWVTPFAAILDDVGPGEMWEGAPAHRSGRCTELDRTARHGRYTSPIWLLETLNVLVQVILDFGLLVAPTAAVAWLALELVPVRGTDLAGAYFEVTPLAAVVWHMGLYAAGTTLVSLVLVSVLGCLFLRWTASTPGLYPVRGLGGAFLLYRVKLLNQIQRQWTWTITGQYLRALAGLRFTRLGASECDYMLNLIPEAASAHALVFWSHACFTNMLDYGARHLTLRPLEMPANFFAGNNSVAESGHLPSNFLLGVSTPGSDIRFRCQMRSRRGEDLTVAGSPPVRFASTHPEGDSEAPMRPSLPLFLARVLLNDVLNSGVLRVAELVAYVILFTVLLRWSVPVLVSALTALVLTELVLVGSSVLVKRLLVGRWGSAHATPFWSLRHFTYFFAQDCFFAWCRGPLQLAAGTVLPNVVLRWMGCRIGKRTLVTEPLQASDWNAVSFGDDCVVGGFLQYHTLENMTLKVKRTDIQGASAVNFGATVMGGALLGPQTTLLPLSMVLKEMRLPSGIYWGSPTEMAPEEHQGRT